MVKLRYGTQGQVSFSDLNEYYFALGFLANSRNAELRWENNEDQGAWGSEGRIHCMVPESRFPQCYRFTAGRGNIYARINCNEYVGTLVLEHNFKTGSSRQDIDAIMETVPEKYRNSFQDGYGSTVDMKVKFKGNNTSHLTKSVPQPEVKSEVKPDKIKLSVGQEIKHKSFGVGKVKKLDGDYIKIDFPKVGEKTFANPDAFLRGFLSL